MSENSLSDLDSWPFPCVCVPDLLELPGQDLQVVEGPPHGEHHLCVVAGGHADVPALRLLPLAH